MLDLLGRNTALRFAFHRLGSILPSSEYVADWKSDHGGAQPLPRFDARRGWTSLVVFVLVILVLRMVDSSAVFEPPYLAASLHWMVFAGGGMVSAFLAARAYLAGGALCVLALGCGAILVGGACAFGSILLSFSSSNDGVTTHNLTMLLSSLVFLSGAIAMGLGRQTSTDFRGAQLAICYVNCLFVPVAIGWASVAGKLPPFVFDGQSSSMRSAVLAMTTQGYLIAAIILGILSYRTRSMFLQWYALGLALMTVGLIGVGLTSSIGSALSWSGRLAQMFGEAFILISLIELGRSRGVGSKAMAEAFDDVEAQLRQSEQRLSMVLEAGGLGFWGWHIPSGAVYFGGQWSRMLGYEPGEIEPHVRAWERLIHPDDMNRTLRVLTEHLEGRTPFYDCEHRLLHKDGTYRWILDRGRVVLRDNQGRPIRAIGTHADVTARKQVEDAIRASEERYRLLGQTMLQGVVHQSADGTVIDMNPAAEEILGRTRQEILGSTSVNTRHHTLREDGTPFPGSEHPAMVALRTGQAVRAVVMGFFNPKLNVYRWISVDAVPVIPPGEAAPREVYTVYSDITDRRLAAQAMQHLNSVLEQRVAERTAEVERKAQQLRELAAELTRSEEQERRRLAHVLHDHLQQILVAAKMRMHTLESQLPTPHFVTQMREIARLLDESIQESRSVTADLSPPVLYEGGLAAGLRWLARRMEDKHQFTVKVEALQEDEPVNLDLRVFLFQAARELVFNAAKHAGVNTATIHLRRQQQRVQLIVEDQGRGIDAEKAMRPHGSEGFGLFSIRERLQLLGGSMRIEGSLGQGTRIVLEVADNSLPVNEKPPLTATVT